MKLRATLSHASRSFDVIDEDGREVGRVLETDWNVERFPGPKRSVVATDHSGSIIANSLETVDQAIAHLQHHFDPHPDVRLQFETMHADRVAQLEGDS